MLHFRKIRLVEIKMGMTQDFLKVVYQYLLESGGILSVSASIPLAGVLRRLVFICFTQLLYLLHFNFL
ncbi:unnamed protein product, partial [Vitis vinifera]|uniref:Uncharacterized protein n=1 Tax=Vitis vinifera TaxID=29760 RepID=D7SLQ3_VITVI